MSTYRNFDGNASKTIFEGELEFRAGPGKARLGAANARLCGARRVQLTKAMGISAWALLLPLEKGMPYAELGLADPKWTDDELIDVMLRHPILINRPIVETSKGVRLCRPSEKVLEILPNPQIGTFVKEDGEAIVGGHAWRRAVNEAANGS